MFLIIKKTDGIRRQGKPADWVGQDPGNMDGIVCDVPGSEAGRW